MSAETITIRVLPSHVLESAIRVGGESGVNLLCDWWNEDAPDETLSPDHFDVYVQLDDDRWVNLVPGAAEPRTAADFNEGASAAVCGDVLLEFGITRVAGRQTLSYDLTGRLLSGVFADPSTFRGFAIQNLRYLARRPPWPQSLQSEALP